MKRLPFALLFASGLVGFGIANQACGGISDPTIKNERVATVSGALTGTAVPANARIAFVWRKGASGGFEVAHEAPVVGGSFSMNIVTPPDGFYFSADGARISSSKSSSGNAPSIDESKPAPGGESGTATPTPPPAPAPGGKGITPVIGTRDGVSGTITTPLEAAVGGFVVYVDTNGNGKLDLEGSHAGSPDQILGGNRDLLLVSFRGGGTLDYEKLRDGSGMLPTAGFNLMWDEKRWVGLDLVELKISDKAKLPSGVCASESSVDEPPSATSREPVPQQGGGGTTETGYPSPTDPGLSCSPDGRSFTYTPTPTPTDCPPPPAPPPPGLCSSDWGDVALPGCAGTGGSWVESIKPGDPAPAGWPCTINDADGGPAPDGGSPDAG
ncbi:MAG: hypothetical protein KF819_08280 [Labilithrix sp.]|nr:hypothetical protein [Labilithrix sp.]